MNRATCVLLVGCVTLASVACSSPAAPFRAPVDAGISPGLDGASADLGVTTDTSPVATDVPCTPGTWLCVNAATAALCGPDGHASQRQTCTPGSVCLGGSVGCGLCHPGAIRCDTAAVDTPQVCAADSTGATAWQNHLACDTASGEHCVEGQCRRPCDMAGGNTNSYLGCEYWSTPTANAGLNSQFDFAAVLANPGTTDAHVTVEGGPLGSHIMRTIAPGAVERINLPWIDVLKGSAPSCFPIPTNPFVCAAYSVYGRPTEHTGAYHIQSDAPLAAYQFNALEYRTDTPSGPVYSYTNDASLLLPQNVLGDARNQDYYVVSQPNFTPMGSLGVYGSFIAVVGGGPADTPETVTITTRATVSDPAMPARELPPGVHTFPLARGEVLQLIGTRTGEDLTGSRVQSNGPLAVFSGNDCTNVPTDRPACDHLEQQILPTSTWGRRYAVSFLRDRVADPTEASVVRVVAETDNTRLSFDGIPTPGPCATVLMAGDFCEFSTSDNFLVTATSPVLVAQFMIGLGSLPQCQVLPGMAPVERDDCVGDPSMALEIPVEQYRARYDLLIPSTYRLNYVNLVAPAGTAITLDGAPLDAARVRGPFSVGTGFEVRVVALDPGPHTLLSQGAVPFGAKVYGVALYTSYMYPAGLDLAAINPPG